MAALEDEGYITQPHTSAGRIPTDKGYRLFVDQLSTVKPLSAAERRAIQTFLEGAVDLDDVVDRTVRLLAQLTRQVAVVQYPSLRARRCGTSSSSALADPRLMLVLITDTGRVEQRVVELPGAVDEDASPTCAPVLNAACAGRLSPTPPALVGELPDAVAGQLTRPAVVAVVDACSRRWSSEPRSGSSSPAPPTSTRFGLDFPPRSGRCSRRWRSRSCCSAAR